MHGLRRTAQAKGRGLLRVLFVWLGDMPTEKGGSLLLAAAPRRITHMSARVTRIGTAALESVAALRPTSLDSERAFALALYRLLARGAPVRREQLAAALNRPASEVWETLKTWPSFIQWDDEQRVVGFGGLTLDPTQHRLVVNGVPLYGWCAWDTLFIPEILGADADVESSCPETGTAISLTVSLRGIDRAEPGGVVLSFPEDPNLEAMIEDVRAAFCRQVHFLSSRRAAAAWTERNEGTTLLTLEEAFALGVRKNQLQFGDLLPVHRSTRGSYRSVAGR
jgi:alkylmercury lyase